MFRTDQPRQSVFRSVLARHTDLEDQNNSGVFFIGLGDQFDDDRRLVREATSAPRAQTHLAATVNRVIRRLGINSAHLATCLTIDFTELAQSLGLPIHWRAGHIRLRDIGGAEKHATLSPLSCGPGPMARHNLVAIELNFE
jgi:hypothetical protein